MNTSRPLATLDRLAGARQRASDLARKLETELRQAAEFTHPDYTAEAVSRVRQERADQVRATYLPQIEHERRTLEGDVQVVRAWAETHGPRIGDDAALQRARMRWEGVREMLAAGMSMPRILANADEETALAVLEWGPAWAQAQAFAGGGPDGRADVESLQNSAKQRLSQVGSQDVAWAIAGEDAARTAQAAAIPWLDYARSIAQGIRPGISGLDVAIQSRMAEQRARRLLQDA